MSEFNRIHCSYHKCLTVYFGVVMQHIYDNRLRYGKGYKHFNSLVKDFYEGLGKYSILSVNNHFLDFEKLGDFRITRFVRDPRDLIVSGYFYHRRGAEDWCNVVDPMPQDWEVVNGTFPAGMGKGHSFSSYLQAVPLEDGLIAEIEFRKKHYESMRLWPNGDPRIKTFRYEDVLGNELKTFREIMNFLKLPFLDRCWGSYYAYKYALAQKGKKSSSQHVRDPEPNQWKKHFTPRVTEFFQQLYGDLPEHLGYAAT